MPSRECRNAELASRQLTQPFCSRYFFEQLGGSVMRKIRSVGGVCAAAMIFAGLSACASGPSGSSSSLPAAGAEASAAETAAATDTKTPHYTAASAARSGKAGACTGSQVAITVPPVPNKVGGMVSGAMDNAGRNVTRNVGTNLVINNVAGQIPGIGGLVAVAATQEAGKEVVRTAQDMRGTWTVSDGSPRCGCVMEFEKSGLIIADYVAKPKGCQHPALAGAARYKIVGSGITTNDLVLFAADNTTEVARLDQKSYDYYQGDVGGVTVTLWR
jgi:hypothetical protein